MEDKGRGQPPALAENLDLFTADPTRLGVHTRQGPPSLSTDPVTPGSSRVTMVHRTAVDTVDETTRDHNARKIISSTLTTPNTYARPRELTDSPITPHYELRRPTPSPRNVPPSLRSPSPFADGPVAAMQELKTSRDDIEAMELDIKLREIELERERVHLEKLRFSVRLKELEAAGLSGEQLNSEVIDRSRQADTAFGGFSNFASRRAALPNMLPTHTPRTIPLQNSDRFTAGGPHGSSQWPHFANRTLPTLNQSQWNARQSKLRDLLPFSGDPDEWTRFIANYERTTLMYGYTDEENVERLSKALSGKAREMVGHRLTSAQHLPQVLNVLRRHFGRPEIIVHHLIRKIRQLPSPRLERADTIIDFGNAVQEMAAVISSSGLYEYTFNVALLQEMVEKLPPVLLRDWSHYRLLLSVPTIDDFKDWIEKEVEAASYNTLPSVHESKTEVKRLEGRKTRPTTYLNAMVSEDPDTAFDPSPSPHRKEAVCVICKGSCHDLEKCPMFLELNMNQRWAVVRGNVCRHCLRRHNGRCKLQKPCGVSGCQLTHHKLLHDTGRKRSIHDASDRQLPEATTPANAVSSSLTESMNSHTSNSDGVLLQYIPVVIFGDGKTVETYAFFDSGSTGTFIEESLANELGLKGTPHPLCIRWTGNIEKEENRSERFVIQIANPDNAKKAFTLSKVHSLQTLSLPSQSFSAVDVAKMNEHLKGLPLRSYKNVRPRLLIGIDNCHLMRPLQYAEGGRNEPAGVKTPLGWIVFGGSGASSRNSSINNMFHICICGTDDLQKIDTVMREFFTLESLGVTKTPIKTLSKDDEKALELLTAATKLKGKRYETSLLWRFDDVRLPSSEDMALRRYECLKRRMRKDPALSRAVREKMNSYIEQGYVRRVSPEEVAARGTRDWFLPVFPVFNPNKPGKIRLVFDAAAKARGVSLNSFLLPGPDLLASLLAVLYKFREHRVAIVGDIKEMFFQVRMRSEDQRSQFFFWDSDDAIAREPAVYAVAVMTFGAACSPSSAQFVKNLNASRFEHRFPRAANCIKGEHYVDDMLASVETEEEAITLAEDVRYIHAEGGFEIRNWLSNSKRVLERLQVERTDGSAVACTGHTAEKVLGMWWDIATDEFTFKLSPKHDVQLLTGRRIPSKKEVLSTLMTVYDPMGLIGNFLMYIKILLQEIWRAGIDWEQELNGRLAEKWISWIKVLPSILSNVRVPRCYRRIVSCEEADIQLHVFCDASENGMAAVAYLRFEAAGLVECALVGSKTRVAPLRFLSIPRLELQAAVIGTRFSDNILKSHRLHIRRVMFWTDSRDVVCWLKSDHRRYSQFVAFRVSEILESTDVKQWRWLSTKLNVADEGTKWQKAPSVDPSSRWFHGPEFLWRSENEWPGNELPSEDTTEEIRLNLFHHTPLQKQWIDVSRFSSWSRLVRTIAYVLRFVTFVSSRRTSIPTGALTQPELARAEQEIFILAQRETYQAEIQRLENSDTSTFTWKPRIAKNSPIYKLCPELDKSGVLRARGRLANCPWVSEAIKHPIILPRNHQVTSLLLKHYHRRYKHSHHQAAVNEIRSHFCISRLTVEYGRMRRACQFCKNRDAQPKPPLMGNLPLQRLGAFQRAFTFTGVDYFGPILVAVGRRVEKRWGVLFTCLTTRAIHLEVAHTLTTSSCIMAIRRFVSRRGNPLEFISDRGTNFVGAARELKEAWKDIDENELMTQFTGPNLRWRFNPPGAPHFGGCWERLVQSVKKVLSVIKMPRHPTDEILLSALTEVEMIVNSRPLTQVPLDDESEPALTPNHFLLGTSNVDYPTNTVDDRPAFLKMNWKASQALAELFWKKWVAEYLPTLTHRGKWCHEVPPVAIGDIVIIVDANLPRNTWPKGRVIDVVTAKDGQVRQATVQTLQGLLVRPAAKLAVLDVNPAPTSCEEGDRAFRETGKHTATTDTQG